MFSWWINLAPLPFKEICKTRFGLTEYVPRLKLTAICLKNKRYSELGAEYLLISLDNAALIQSCRKGKDFFVTSKSLPENYRANTLFTLWTVLMLMSQSGSCAEITQDSHKRCPALRVPCHVDRAQWVEKSVSAWRSEVQVPDQRTDIPPVALFHWNRNRCNEIPTHL